MGDHCGHCPYQRKERLGPQACPFNALYWDFHLRHEALLRRNPRIGMVYRQIERMTPEAKQAIGERASQLRGNLEHV